MTGAEQLDRDTRRVVYETTLTRGTPPSRAEVAQALAATPDDVRASFQRDALVRTSCGDCGAALALRVVGDRVVGDGVLHFAVPARDWWEDIVFT